MVKIRILILICTLLIIGFGVSAENSSLIYGQQDIFWSNKYQENKLNNGDLLISKNRLLSDDVKENVRPIAKINKLLNNVGTDFVFDSFLVGWDLLKQDNESWLVTNNKLISKLDGITPPKQLLISLNRPKFSDKRVSIRDYDTLQIDYKNTSNNQSCNIGAFLNFKGQSWNSKKGLLKPEERWVAYSDYQPMIETNLSDAKAEKWTQKSFDYFISRKFNRKPNGVWRYTKDGKNVVVQRRMHWPINKSSLLAIKHSKEMRIVSASVSVSFEDEYDSGNLLTLEVPLSGILPDGSFGSEFDVGSVITSNYRKLMDDRQFNANKQQSYIQEIFLHIDGDVDEFLQYKPLYSVSLMNLDIESMAHHMNKTVYVRALDFDWREESYSNLLRQFFGESQDEDDAWHWQQNDTVIGIEKNLSWTFKPQSKLAVYLDSNVIVDSVSVQFGTKDGTGREMTIFNPVLTKLPGGKVGLLLDLDALVAEQLLETVDNNGEITQPVLENIKVSIKGDANKVINAKQLREIALFESDINSNNNNDLGFVLKTHQLSLKTHAEKVGNDRERKIFDLSKLTKEAREMTLERGVLNISVPHKERGCQIEIESINLVSSFKVKERGYISKIKNLNKKYGGIFLQGAQRDAVEGLKFLAYSSLVSLYSSNGSNYEKITNIPVNGVGDVLVDRITTIDTIDKITSPILLVGDYSEDVDMVKDVWMTTDGLQFATDGKITSAKPFFSEEGSDEIGVIWTREGKGVNNIQPPPPKGVRIKGNGNELDLSWPVKTKIDKDSIFFLSIPKGVGQISWIKLLINGGNDTHWSQFITANQPISLTDAPNEIKTIMVKIIFKNKDFDLVLDDVLIATPKMMNHRQALTEGIPWKGEQLLKQGELSKGIIQLTDSLEEGGSSYWQEGIVNGSLEMIVPNPSQWFEGMGIEYQIPDEWLGLDGCIIKGEFVFANKTLRRSFCLGQASASQSFTVGELGMLGQEKLEKIIWHITKPEDKHGTVKLSTSITTRGLSSIYNQMKNTPLLYLGKAPYYLDKDNLQEIADNNRGFWIKLSKIFLMDYLNNTSRLTLNKNNPWLEVEKIAVEPESSMGLKDWIVFIKPVKFEKSSIWLELMGYLLLFSSIVMVVRKGWWPSIQSSIVGLMKMMFWQLPKIITAQSWVVGLYVSRWLNVMVGILIVPLLAWLASNSKDVYVTTALLFSAVSFGIGVYRHYAQFGMMGRKTNGVKWLEMAWGLVIVTIILLVFLANIHNKLQWYMFVPLFSALYGMLPEVVQIARELFRSSKALFKTILWGGILVVLYIIGLVNWSNVGENYYFTFGGMAAVIMWRALIVYAKPIISSKWPTIAEKIYGGAGTQYFSGFIVLIIGTTFMLILKLELVAEQLAIIGYYMLVVGVVLEMLDLRKDKSEGDKKGSLDT